MVIHIRKVIINHKREIAQKLISAYIFTRILHAIVLLIELEKRFQAMYIAQSCAPCVTSKLNNNLKYHSPPPTIRNAYVTMRSYLAALFFMLERLLNDIGVFSSRT